MESSASVAPSDWVMEKLDAAPVGAPVAVHVPDGASAWNPASTKRELWGPGTVTYRRHADGGIDAHWNEG